MLLAIVSTSIWKSLGSKAGLAMPLLMGRNGSSMAVCPTARSTVNMVSSKAQKGPWIRLGMRFGSAS